MTEGIKNDSVTVMTAATIDGLDPRTEYEFEVHGINDNGQMGPSVRLNVITSAPTGRQ